MIYMISFTQWQRLPLALPNDCLVQALPLRFLLSMSVHAASLEARTAACTSLTLTTGTSCMLPASVLRALQGLMLFAEAIARGGGMPCSVACPGGRGGCMCWAPRLSRHAGLASTASLKLHPPTEFLP